MASGGKGSSFAGSLTGSVYAVSFPVELVAVLLPSAVEFPFDAVEFAESVELPSSVEFVELLVELSVFSMKISSRYVSSSLFSPSSSTSQKSSE